MFVLPHACSSNLESYDGYAELGLSSGYAVFRWDKRGTGRSGAGGRGSTAQDAINAYETAIDLPHVNKRRVVILALGSASAFLGSAFGMFARVQRPYAALLVGNQLDEHGILAIDTRIFIAQAEGDWHDAEVYAQRAARAHAATYRHGALSFVAPHTDRLLQLTEGVLHPAARKGIGEWLKHIRRIPPRSEWI